VAVEAVEAVEIVETVETVEIDEFSGTRTEPSVAGGTAIE
jgi:hypothetical protein